MNVSFVSSQDIIDGINKTLKNKTDAVINIINDKLTVSVFALLEQNLRNVKEINFIIRDSRYLPKGEEVSREFEININDVLFNSYDITEKNKLQHFYQAKAMHNFIKKHVNVKRVTNACSVKSNLICIDNNFMFTGQSSLEMPDKRNSSVFAANFDAIVTDNDETGKEQIARCSEMFNQLWYNEQFTVSYKEQLLESLHFVYKEHSPELLYYFTLNELFGNQLDQGVERFERDSDKFKKTEIWNALYDFQKDCVVSAIRKLQKYRGCIIADSVGLGKTFEALAVIKYFEIAMDRVLVLTPAKLYDNWNSFRGDYKDSFLHESFNYRIMFHTDLSRYKGMSRSGQDLKKFDWGLYDLVVIDESHNFRNRNDRYDENDQLVMTRYARLMQDVIKHGNNNTKVLLLSATPVNNSLVDLKNQISIITRDEDYAFEDEGISSVENLLRKSSQVINTWEKKQNHTKDELLDDLPSDFYKLLEIMTISRSRKHIMNYYANGDVGTFPEKNKPITMHNNIDTQNQLLTFKKTNELLELLNLSVYTPMRYVKPEFMREYIEKYNLKGKRGGNMDFSIQSKGMIVLHRFNLFKRLESSVYSFEETLHRLLENIDKTIENLNKGTTVTQQDYEYEDDELVLESSKYEINIKHLRVEDYINDLYEDRFIINNILEQAQTILKEHRDAKIKELEELVVEKINTTPYNAGNKKVLIFTAFADTANYIYSTLGEKLRGKGIYCASVTGKGVRLNNPNVESDFNSVLCAFSPMSKMKKQIPEREQIDVLIGTDCISEGQNLQDCDTVINYDVQWNPVSLIQRFGRIDRIGSTNKCIQLINFFPEMQLNDYLNLERRVKGKMVLSNLVSTGEDDLLNPEMNDFAFRTEQLIKIQNEVIDIDDASDSISLTDLNQNEYLYELSDFVNSNKTLKAMPRGIYSVTDGEDAGALFCFKHRNEKEKPKSDSSIYPFYLIYVKNDGEILYTNLQSRMTLKLFRKLCYGKKEPNMALFEKFFKRTNNAKEMSFYSGLLNKGIRSIQGEEEKQAVQTVFDFSGFNNSFADETADDFELISFLVVES